MDIKAIKGKIVSISDNKRNITIIDNDKTKKTIDMNYNLPIKIGDTILTEKYYTKMVGRNQIYKLNDFPIIIIGMDDSSVKSYVYSCLRGVENANVLNILNTLSQESEISKQPLYKKISEITSIYSKKSQNEKDDYIRNNYNKGEKNLNGIEKVFSNWEKLNVDRQLMLFGFSKSELKSIKKFNTNKDDNYKLSTKFLENPLNLFVINKDKLLQWCERLYKPYIHDYRYNILHEIFKNFKNGNNGYSIEQLNKIEKNEDITNKIKLCSEYMISYNNFLYFHDSFKKEEYISKRIKEIKCSKNYVYDEDRIESIYCEGLSPDQKLAIKGSVNKNISIICGAAGTGKTTILNKLIRIFEDDGKIVTITAFTGKAVARLKEVLTRDDPCTIHQLLFRNKKNKKFREITEKSINFDVLIVDEASMVSMGLLFKIFDTYNFSFKIYLIGDDSQLPPIQWGRPFYDIIQSGMIDVFELTTCHRFYNKDGEINGIIENAKGIRNKKDKWILKCESNFEISTINSVSNIVSGFIENGISYHDFTILSPFNEPLEKINSMVSSMVFPNTLEVTEPINHKSWRIGDRVIHKVNNYEIDVMNGDEGIIVDWMYEKNKDEDDKKTKDHDEVKNEKEVNDDKGKIVGMVIAFGKMQKSKNIEFPFQKNIVNKNTGNKIITKINLEDEIEDKEEEEIKEEITTENIDRSYAMTIHKSQGSEWKHIILFLGNNSNNSQPNSFLTRNLFYTGITRARETVTILTKSLQSVNNIIKNDANFGNDALIKLLRN
jgi:exodeoxyribonuclease V alpha subunit